MKKFLFLFLSLFLTCSFANHEEGHPCPEGETQLTLVTFDSSGDVEEHPGPCADEATLFLKSESDASGDTEEARSFRNYVHEQACLFALQENARMCKIKFENVQNGEERTLKCVAVAYQRLQTNLGCFKVEDSECEGENEDCESETQEASYFPKL